MKKKRRSKVKYTDDKGEMDGELRIVGRGELPDLDSLLDKLPEKTKVTLELDNSALEFFKREARKRNTSYQRMIRNLVRSYAQSHS
jgi:predicted DNA binding CopG/RHH family protein